MSAVARLIAREKPSRLETLGAGFCRGPHRNGKDCTKREEQTFPSCPRPTPKTHFGSDWRNQRPGRAGVSPAFAKGRAGGPRSQGKQLFFSRWVTGCDRFCVRPCCDSDGEGGRAGNRGVDRGEATG